MRARSAVAVLFLLGLALPSDVHAQLSKLKNAAKQAAGQAATRAVTGAVTGPADTAKAAGAADTTRVNGGAGTSQGATANASSTPVAADATTSPQGAPGTTATMPRPGEGAWVNYDFVPGDRPIFVESFEDDAVGDFPRRIEFRSGNMEVAEWQGRRWLRATTKATFALPLPEVLPETFTLEFDYAGINKYDLEIRFTDDPGDHTAVLVGAWEVGVRGAGIEALKKPDDDVESRIVHVRVMADGRYVKVYLDGERVANVPNADLGRTAKIHFMVPVYDNIAEQALLADLRVMAGGRTLYDAIAADGRVATQGILFDTGSDILRPESTPTLTAIAGMLEKHPDLALRIEGHTDAVGDDDANRALSERRAAAVVAYLTGRGIQAARLEAAGLGETAPVADNDTPEGRQANRRVELVRK